MRSASNIMERRTHVNWKEYNVERMEAHKINVDKPGFFQKWMKKIEHPDMNERTKNEESLTFYEAYTGSFGSSHVHMSGDL
jgi:mevalonate pyrophosphate decarboxylase